MTRIFPVRISFYQNFYDRLSCDGNLHKAFFHITSSRTARTETHTNAHTCLCLISKWTRNKHYSISSFPKYNRLLNSLGWDTITHCNCHLQEIFEPHRRQSPPPKTGTEQKSLHIFIPKGISNTKITLLIAPKHTTITQRQTQFLSFQLIPKGLQF